MKTNKYSAQWLCRDSWPLVSGSLETILNKHGPLKSLATAPVRTCWKDFSSFNGVRLVEDFHHHLHSVIFRVQIN